MTAADWLTLFMAGVVAFAVGMYVVLDGLDLGVGILFPFADDDAQRQQMMNSIAPFWDGNETWLVLGGAILLLARFRSAFAVISCGVSADHRDAAGLDFSRRGVRVSLQTSPAHLGRGIRSWLDDCHLRARCGAWHLRARHQDGEFSIRRWSVDWLTPFSMVTGVALLCGYALLGNTWLFWRSYGTLQEKARTWMPVLLVGMLAAIAAISIWTPLMSPAIAARWFDFPKSLAFAPVPVLTAACAWGAYRAIKKTPSAVPFVLCVGLFFLGYSGLAISIFQTAATFTHAVRGGRIARVATLSLAWIADSVPLILIHTWVNYRVFHVKSEDDAGYGH